MVQLSEEYRSAPDAKVLALIQWIRQHQCAAVEIGGAKKKVDWSGQRVIIFTEYGHTKRYLWDILSAAVEGTSDADPDERTYMTNAAITELANNRPRAARFSTVSFRKIASPIVSIVRLKFQSSEIAHRGRNPEHGTVDQHQALSAAPSLALRGALAGLAAFAVSPSPVSGSR